MLYNKIKEITKLVHPDMINYRRMLHMNPELSFDEKQTSEYICSLLSKWNIKHQRLEGCYGVVAKICGIEPGPIIAFRADIDALPINEENNIEFKSKNIGIMHACGHDAHTTILLGLAQTMKENQDLIKGEVRLIFQHAEEQPPGGALDIINAGYLDDVDSIYGIHVTGDIPVGTIAVVNGASMPSNETLKIKICGGGGHGALPGDTQDTILASSMGVLGINTVTGRGFPYTNNAVVSICKVHGGASYNVIPDIVNIEGTIRTYDKETKIYIHNKIEQIIDGVCRMFDTKYDIEFIRGYPALVNWSEKLALVKDAMNKVQGINLTDNLVTMASEDFAYYLQKTPGCFIWLGVRGPNNNNHYPLHHYLFDIDEDALAVGLMTYWSIYLEEIKRYEENK